MWWYREGNKEQGWRRVGAPLSKHCSHICVISGFFLMSSLSSDPIVFNNLELPEVEVLPIELVNDSSALSLKGCHFAFKSDLSTHLCAQPDGK
jgi:hypothetical protein